jgi:hypothetical protein
MLAAFWLLPFTRTLQIVRIGSPPHIYSPLRTSF